MDIEVPTKFINVINQNSFNLQHSLTEATITSVMEESPSPSGEGFRVR
jgi:hypothetical protein